MPRSRPWQQHRKSTELVASEPSPVRSRRGKYSGLRGWLWPRLGCPKASLLFTPRRGELGGEPSFVGVAVNCESMRWPGLNEHRAKSLYFCNDKIKEGSNPR